MKNEACAVRGCRGLAFASNRIESIFIKQPNATPMVSQNENTARTPRPRPGGNWGAPQATSSLPSHLRSHQHNTLCLWIKGSLLIEACLYLIVLEMYRALRLGTGRSTVEPPTVVFTSSHHSSSQASPHLANLCEQDADGLGDQLLRGILACRLDGDCKMSRVRGFE